MGSRGTGGFSLEEVGPGGFAEAYALLDAEFGARGELERPEALRGAIQRGEAERDGFSSRYHLLLARDAEGRAAGVRDAWVVERGGVCVVYLAHTLVLPPYRRSGLAERLRAAPVELARRRWPHASDLLVAAEMEFPDPAEEATLVRLVSYGRAGYAAIPPDVLPYAQPDFRDPARIDVPRPVPLLAVVRRPDAAESTSMPARLAAAYVEHLYAAFATHCDPAHLAGPRDRALGALAASGLDPVPLVALPRSVEEARGWAGRLVR